MALSFTITGIDDTQRFLEMKNRLVSQKIQEANDQVALFMEGEVKASIAGQRDELTSVDTGRFMNSVQGRANNEGAIISTELDYPVYLEEGTSRIPPRRHFQNSLERNQSTVKEYYESKVADATK